jgi:putative transposase
MHKLSLMPGSLVRCRDRDAIVLDFVDLETVLVEFGTDASISPVKVSELSPPTLAESSKEAERLQRLAEVALPLISDQRWRAARERLDALRDILLLPKHKRRQADIQLAAERLGKSRPTIYRWLDRYESSGSIRSLMRLDRSDRGVARIDEALEQIVSDSIESFFLKGKKSPATVVEEIRKRCFDLDITAPHASTIMRRLAMLKPKEVSERREGKKIAKEKYGLQRGTYPDVLYPLAHSQIDHTPADYCIVDEIHRKPLPGSPTFTLNIDVNTRCILGFTLSLEAPSIRLAGECVIHSFLRKERFLAELDVNAEWPCYGVPSVIMTDNASEFEAKDFIRACNEWGVEVRKRPKGAPNYAGLVESTFRTYLGKIHELEGGRQPGKGQRANAYDIQGRPVMTLREFRRWMTLFITKYYHQQPHSGLQDLPPLVAWKRGILGWNGQKGIGLPDQITDEFKLRVDFLPSIEPTVQKYGVRFAHHHYKGDILRQWVGSRSEDNPRHARTFIVKYDPWDITEIYFLDPIVGRYYPLIADTKLEHLTLWECKAARLALGKDNRSKVDERLIYEGMDEMRAQVAASARTTSKARRDQQRRLDSQEFSVKTQRQRPGHALKTSDASNKSSASIEEDDGPLKPLSGTIEARVPTSEPA